MENKSMNKRSTKASKSKDIPTKKPPGRDAKAKPAGPGSANMSFQENTEDNVSKMKEELMTIITTMKAEYTNEIAGLRDELAQKHQHITDLNDEVFKVKQEMNIFVNSIKAELKEVVKSIEFVHGKLNDCDRTYNDDQKAVQEETDDIYSKLQYLNDKTRDLEDRSRRDNLVFRNVPEVDEGNRESNDDCEKKLKEELKRVYPAEQIDSIKFERVHRLGRRNKDNKETRPVIAKFSFHKDRNYILYNSSNLGKSGNTNKLNVNEDFSENTLAVRSKLWNAAREAKREYSSNATYEITYVKLVYRRVVISYKNKASGKYFSRGFSLNDINTPDWYHPKFRNS